MERRDELHRRLSPGWFVLLLAAGLLVAFLNGHHDIEQGIYRSHYVPMAEYFQSGTHSDELTYPLWGYPLVMALLPKHEMVVPLQIILSSIAMFALLSAMVSERVARPKVLLTLFVVAWPWYTLHSVKWPMSPAVSLTVLSLVLLWRALDRRVTAPAAAGGILAGLALNFRSDFLLLGLLVLFMVLVSKLFKQKWTIPAAPVVVYILVSVLCLVPWALHYRQETGHFSLTSSHGGMVAYITLGQLPSNPWGIIHNDGSARDAVHEVDPELRPYSDEGNRILMDKFLSNVRSQPVAFVRKVVRNFTHVFVGGFYNGEPPPRSGAQDTNLEIMKEKLKERLGFHPNVKEIAAYKESGAWDEFTLEPGTVAVMAILLLATAAGAVYLLLALLGLLASLPRIVHEPLYLVTSSFVLYVLATVSLFQYQPRHVNPLVLCAAPFFVAGVGVVSRFLKRLLPRRGAAALR